MRTLLKKSSFLASAFFVFSLEGSVESQVPVTGAPPSSESDLRFVVMADRTGGMQAGIFEDAIAKADLLHPEFVISVGDLIDGYTLDPALLDAQWKEFDAMVEAIDMPFYYVPGNHDISNPWMEEEWRRRLGDPYYHFVYKDVLFLVLHTEDGGKSGISKEQGDYVRAVLAQREEVRWTFVFMHRPLWSYGNQEGFERIEAALGDRRYTLFSGHHHNYFYSNADGNERLILGTSGGGSHLRGPEVGEFHHITYVALTEAGPKIAHLKLDGFVPKDIVNEGNRAMVETLRGGAFVSFRPVVATGVKVERLGGVAELHNPAALPLRVEGRFPELASGRFEPAEFAVELEPGERRRWPFALLSSGGGSLDLEAVGVVTVEVAGAFHPQGSELRLPAEKEWTLDWNRILDTAKPEPTVDGDLSEWNDAQWIALDPPGYFEEGWDWRGPEDASVRFALREGDASVFIAMEANDDRFLFLDGPLRDAFTVFVRSGEGPAFEVEFRPEADSSLEVVSELDDVSAAASVQGRLLRVEASLPKDALGSSRPDAPLRLNLRYMDHDRPENQKPSRLYWKPRWGSEADFDGSGLFLRNE